jgi:hypothetical protein
MPDTMVCATPSSLHRETAPPLEKSFEGGLRYNAAVPRVLPLTNGRRGSNRSARPAPWRRFEPWRSRDFRTTLFGVRIHASARKHGVADDDIRHAVDHALVIEDTGEDP